MYKLIASDVDGTIMPDNEVATQRTRRAVELVNTTSAIMSLSTGRRIASTEVVANTLGISNNPLICHCGAVITLPSQKKIIKATHISSDIAFQITKMALNSGSSVSILENVYEGRRIFQLPLPHYFRTVAYNSWYGSYCRPCELSEVKNLSDPIQISLQGKADFVVRAYNDIKTVFKDTLVYVDYGTLSSGDYVIDIFGTNVSKAQALLVLMDIYKIDVDEVVAFGDGLNDLEILGIAGLSVAMENAINHIKDRCMRVTLSNNEDGVAHVIEELYNKNLLISPTTVPTFP